jgi:hypothetical protein
MNQFPDSIRREKSGLIPGDIDALWFLVNAKDNLEQRASSFPYR